MELNYSELPLSASSFPSSALAFKKVSGVEVGTNLKVDGST